MNRKNKKELEKRLRTAENGSMVNNMEDAKYLGEQMDHMRSNEELKEYGRIPDPIQFEIEVEEEKP